MPSQPRVSDFLRLLAGAAMVALASLSLFNAPIWPIMMLRIAVTELGYTLALPAATLLTTGHNTPLGRLASALGLLAAGLGLAPVLSAARIGRRLPAQLATAFGDATPRAGPGAPPRSAPIVAADLLRGLATPPVQCSQRIYIARDRQPLTLDLYQ